MDHMLDLADLGTPEPGAIAVGDPSAPRGWRWEVPAELAVQKRGDLYGFADVPKALPIGLPGQILEVDAETPTLLAWKYRQQVFTIYCGAPGSQVVVMQDVGYLRVPQQVTREELVLTLFKPSTEDLTLHVRSGTVSESLTLPSGSVLHRYQQSLVIPNEGLVEIDVVQAAGDARGLSVMLVGRVG